VRDNVGKGEYIYHTDKCQVLYRSSNWIIQSNTKWLVILFVVIDNNLGVVWFFARLNAEIYLMRVDDLIDKPLNINDVNKRINHINRLNSHQVNFGIKPGKKPYYSEIVIDDNNFLINW
jgi:hypothetical protein